MHARQPVPAELVALADHQARVVTREQALGLDFGRHAIQRMITSGQWRALARGIYFLYPLEPPWLSWAWAGVLIGGDHARIGGAAAGHLHGIVSEPPAAIRVWVPADGGRPRITGPWQFRREVPGSRRGSVGRPPRLGIEDTLLDLAADPELSERDLVGLITSAVQARRTTHERLRRAMSRQRYVGHRRLLDGLLGDLDAGVRSPLERDYLRDVERAHGLPRGDRQQQRRNTEADVWYKAFGVLVELDGRLGHTGPGRFRDMWRDNVAAVDGLVTLRYGHHDVHDFPCPVADQVGAVLIQRGWEGPISRCPRCRLVA